MSSFDADVIVVGAGPAGTISAYELARLGKKVLIFEKEIFPRYKVCGGGLTHKIIKEIPFDVSPVIETVINTVRFSHRFTEIFPRTADDAFIYCTMRSELDLYLLKKATEAGAEVVTSIVKDIQSSDGGITVNTGEKSYRSRLLIGADGAAGITARTFGLRRNIEKGLAWEAEIQTDPSVLEKYKDTVFLDWGTLPGGYGWVFPKKDHFSAGVGGPAKLSGLMMDYYRNFLDSCGIFDLEKDLIISIRSWPIPVRTKRSCFHSSYVMIAGDAAGLTDPLTGEGIYYAVRSGKLAAEAAREYLEGDRGALKNYSKKINSELMSELTEAIRIRDILNLVPGKIHRFVRDSDRAWGAFAKILRGERQYKDVKTGFGRWKYAWTVVAAIAHLNTMILEKATVRKGKKRS